MTRFGRNDCFSSCYGNEIGTEYLFQNASESNPDANEPHLAEEGRSRQCLCFHSALQEPGSNALICSGVAILVDIIPFSVNIAGLMQDKDFFGKGVLTFYNSSTEILKKF